MDQQSAIVLPKVCCRIVLTSLFILIIMAEYNDLSSETLHSTFGTTVMKIQDVYFVPEFAKNIISLLRTLMEHDWILSNATKQALSLSRGKQTVHFKNSRQDNMYYLSACRIMIPQNTVNSASHWTSMLHPTFWYTQKLRLSRSWLDFKAEHLAVPFVMWILCRLKIQSSCSSIPNMD